MHTDEEDQSSVDCCASSVGGAFDLKILTCHGELGSALALHTHFIMLQSHRALGDVKPSCLHVNTREEHCQLYIVMFTLDGTVQVTRLLHMKCGY